MDLSSITSLLAPQPSLADYLDGNNNGSSATDNTGATPDLLSILDAGIPGANTSGDSVDLSSLAQQLAGQTASTASSGSTGVQQAATSFLNSFFTGSGIDTGNLSPDAQNLLQGFQAMIANSNTTARDSTTDSMEEQNNNGNRQVYTLTGDNRRLRIAIDYKNGAPQTLTITDINGGQVDTAAITVANDSGGAPATINIARAQRQYLNGTLVSSTNPASLSVNVYDSGGASS